MVCRKTLERISWRVRYFFLEGPVFLPGESGISSWRVRYFFLESPVFLPGESGISSWRVRYFFLASPGQSRERPFQECSLCELRHYGVLRSSPAFRRSYRLPEKDDGEHRRCPDGQ